MSWAGFSSGGFGGAGGAGGSGGSGYPVNFTYANRGGAGRGGAPFSAGYGRGSSTGTGGGGYGGGAVGRGGFSYGAGINSGGGFGGSNGLAGAAGDQGGTETPRVAIVGVSSAVTAQWAALHAGGMRVDVVVGTGDSSVCHSRYTGAAADTTTTTVPVISLAERTAAAEAARACATRCVDLFNFPMPTKSAQASTTPGTTAAGAGGADAGTAAGKSRIAVRVCVSDGSESVTAATGNASTSFSTPPPPAASTITMTTLAGRRASAAATSDADRDSSIVATSWSWFFKPMLDAIGGTDKGTSGSSAFSASPSKMSAGSYWSARGSATSTTTTTTTGAAANTPLLIDEVEVVYVLGCGAACDEAGLRATLIWLLEREKHLIVDCALSCETLATCAAVAAGVARGRPEMKRVFLYRGGGARRGWADVAMSQLRKAIGLQRGTGTPPPAKALTPPPARGAPTTATTTTAASSAAPTPSKGGNVFTTASTKAAAAAAAAASDGDDGFSVFDLMGSSFGGALKDAEASGSEKSSAKASPAVTSLLTPSVASAIPAGDAGKTSGTSETAPPAASGGTPPPPPPPPPPPAPTSIALDGSSSVVGTVRRITLTMMGRAPPAPRGCAKLASLGVMATLGWDAVAAALRLMDWTCPDMVVGHVRRGRALHPTCVQAELYYGVDGTAKESGDITKDSGPAASGAAVAEAQTTTTNAPQPVRPTYLCVSLYVADTASTTAGDEKETLTATSGDDAGEDEDVEEDGGGDVVQQSLRIIGSKAVLTVLHPLVPLTAPVATSATTSRPAPAATTTTVSGAAPLLTPTPTPMPSAPKVTHRYVLATQDVDSTTGQRERRESTVDVGGGEPAAAFRLWQRVRSQLRVTTQRTTSTSLGAGAGAGGGYQPYGSRYGNRGVSGAGGYHGRGRGAGRGRATGFGGASVMTGATVTPSGPSLKAELTGTEAAAQDVQHAWLVQKVVECILESAVPAAKAP